MSDLAASGGYYMAMTGDPIAAYPQTETGSIGVVFGKPNLHGLYDKLGDHQRRHRARQARKYRFRLHRAHAGGAAGAETGHRRELSGLCDQGGHRPPPSFRRNRAVAQGRVWLGSQARPRNLVDELGGLDTAVEMVKKKANIPAGEQISIVVYPARRSIFDMLLRRSQEDMLEARLAQVFGKVPYRAWMRGGMLRVLPYWISIQ